MVSPEYRKEPNAIPISFEAPGQSLIPAGIAIETSLEGASPAVWEISMSYTIMLI